MTEEQRLRRNARARKQYNKNKEKAKARMRIYQQSDKFKQYSAEYREEHKVEKANYDNERRG